MKLAIISDLHIKETQEDSNLLLSFLNHPEVQTADQVFFLGDIFDLMVGNHQEYLKRYSYFFDWVMEHPEKTIYYFEGNHDLHLSKFFKNWCKEKEISHFRYYITFRTLNISGKDYMFGHGDSMEQGSFIHRAFRKLIFSPFSNWLINVLPFPLVQFVATFTSSITRFMNFFRYRKFKNLDLRRKLFRQELTNFIQTLDHKPHYLFLGHSHVRDQALLDGVHFYNAGHPIKDQIFLTINDGKVSFIDLV